MNTIYMQRDRRVIGSGYDAHKDFQLSAVFTSNSQNVHNLFMDKIGEICYNEKTVYADSGLCLLQQEVFTFPNLRLPDSMIRKR